MSIRRVGERRAACSNLEPHDRDVAQLGSAPDWGSGGRGFKSCRPDSRPAPVPVRTAAPCDRRSRPGAALTGPDLRGSRTPLAASMPVPGARADRLGIAEVGSIDHPQRAERRCGCWACRCSCGCCSARTPTAGRWSCSRSPGSPTGPTGAGAQAQPVQPARCAARSRSPTGSTSSPRWSGWCCATSSRCGWRS